MDSIHLQPKFRKFKELRCLKFDYSRMANEDEMFLSILKASNTKYHNTCQSSYSDKKVKRFRLSNEKQLAKASRKESENEVPQNWSRRSAEEPKPSHANKLQCYWCTQFHDEANLWAAGERWTKTKLNLRMWKPPLISGKKWLQLSNTTISMACWAMVTYQIMSVRILKCDDDNISSYSDDTTPYSCSQDKKFFD